MWACQESLLSASQTRIPQTSLAYIPCLRQCLPHLQKNEGRTKKRERQGTRGICKWTLITSPAFLDSGEESHTAKSRTSRSPSEQVHRAGGPGSVQRWQKCSQGDSKRSIREVLLLRVASSRVQVYSGGATIA